MNYFLKIHILALFVFLACSSQRSMLERGPGDEDTFQWLSRLSEEPISQGEPLSGDRIAAMTTLFDSLCASSPGFSIDDNFEKLEKKLEKITRWDRMIEKVAAEQETPHLALAAKEFEFKVFSGTQSQMEDIFNAPERHKGFVFDKKVSMMLPYIQASQKFSKAKSSALMDIIRMLASLEEKDEKKRAWLAIDRMTREIDLLKSESGYKPFQRSAKGIYIQKGEMISRLKTRLETETDPEIRQYAETVVTGLKQRTRKELEPEFWQQVEESKEIRQLIKENEHSSASIKPDQKVVKEAKTAVDWFHVAINTGNPLEKILYYSRAIELDSLYTKAFNNRGNIYQKLDQPLHALQDYNKALELDPNASAVLVNRAHIYQEMGEYRNAIRDYSRAIDLDSPDSRLYISRAACYAGLEAHNESIQDYHRAIDHDPDNAKLYHKRGDRYRLSGRYNEAILDYSRSIEIDASNDMVYNHRGLTHNQLGQHKRAIEDFNRAITLNPDSAPAFFNLGIAYWELADWENVIESWETCLQINPDYSPAKEWLPKARQVATPRKITIEREVTVFK
ncbi:tetratricopeptide repeat protein [candidate division KSB1 bacterium]|nr:tetratricopeptide repeat protein [candidate division KSB1 bacterium]